MAAGKWIAELSPDMPCLDAARHVLTIRLETVRQFLETIRADVDKDPEPVHRLRVSTRRAKAALDVFGDYLPKKAAKKIKKSLKKFRHTAGAVRDRDVFLQGLSSHKETRQKRLQPALDLVNGLALSERDAARTVLVDSSADQPFAFERIMSMTLSKLRRPRGGANVRLGDVATRLLSQRLEALRKSAESAEDDSAKLHRVRIDGKRLRYAMEFFGDCFTAEYKERLYPLVEEMQEILGNLHDSDVAARQLQSWRERTEAVFPAEAPRYGPGFDVLIKSHLAIVSEKRESFYNKWREWEEAIGSVGLESLHVNDQRGFVSIAGKESTAPAGRPESPPPDEEVGLKGPPPGGSV